MLLYSEVPSKHITPPSVEAKVHSVGSKVPPEGLSASSVEAKATPEGKFA